MLALLWFTPLVLLVLVRTSGLTLLCAGLLFTYGLLLFRAGEKLSASYRPSRFFPWLVWVLALFGLTSFQSFPVPVIAVSQPARDLYSIPLSVNGVRHGMSPEEVYALHGEPAEHQIQHTILPIRIYAGQIQILLAEVMRLQFKFSDSIQFSNRDELDFLLGKQIGARPRAQEASSANAEFDAAEVAIDQVRENLEIGYPLFVYATGEELTNKTIEDLVVEQENYDEPDRAYLFVNKTEAVYVTDFAKRGWSYPDQELSIVFGKDDKVISLQGSELWLGNRLWARNGDPLDRIQHPGEPVQADDEQLQAIFRNRLPEVSKKWGSRSIGVRVANGVIEGFEL